MSVLGIFIKNDLMIKKLKALINPGITRAHKVSIIPKLLITRKEGINGTEKIIVNNTINKINFFPLNSGLEVG